MVDYMDIRMYPITVLKLGQFAMSDTCEKWFGLVNSCAYYALQAREINQVLPYLVDFEAPGELWNPLTKTVLTKANVVLIGIKDLQTYKMTVKLKSNVDVGPVNISLIFATAISMI